MSMRAMEEIGRTCGAMAVAVYAGLCHCKGAYHSRNWFPATDRYLAGLIGCDRKTVRRQVSLLEEFGFVMRKAPEGSGTGHMTLYALSSIAGLPTASRLAVGPVMGPRVDPLSPPTYEL